MILNILLLFYPILILVATICCYKKINRCMNAFYIRMSFTNVARRFYVQIFMLLLILFQYLQIRCHAIPADTFLPFCITALLIRFTVAERIMYLLKKQKLVMGVGVVVLACLFIPHMYSLAVSLAVLMTGAIFYPSHAVRKLVERPDAIVHFKSNPSVIAKCYY